MRALILIAGALALASCGKNNQAANTQNVDETLTAENIVSNDVTAIDAVTADAANMAAESNIDDIPEANVGTGEMNSPVKPAVKRPPAKAIPDEPTANIAGNAAGNSAE